VLEDAHWQIACSATADSRRWNFTKSVAFHVPHPGDVAISQKTFDWQLIGLCDRIRQGIEALLELTHSFSSLGYEWLPHVVAQLQGSSADHATSWYLTRCSPRTRMQSRRTLL
jgi:hypothetical protein